MVGALALLYAAPAAAQLAIPGAEKGRISILGAGSTLFADVSSAKLGITYRSNSHLEAHDCRTEPDPQACMQSALDDDRWYVELGLAISGKDGKRDLFSGGSLVPGIEIGVVGGHQWEHSGEGFSQLYGGVAASAIGVDVVDTVGAVAELTSLAHRGIAGVLGYSHFFDESLGVSLNGRVGGEWSSPGVRKLKQVCQDEFLLPDSLAVPTTVRSCKDRYVGPLDDGVVVGQVRVEFSKTFPRVGAESFGVLAALQISPREDTKAPWAFTIGGFVTPKGRPHQVLVATLVQFTDFTDANDGGKDFGDIFSVGLRLGVPLTGF